MTSLHHFIIAASDRDATAAYLRDLLELPEPWENGVFLSFQLEDQIVVNIAGAPPHAEIHPQHYAFLISEDQFDRIRARFEAGGTEYWADPQRRRPGEIGQANSGGEGRRLYFFSPEGHYLEVITARYEDVPAAARPD